jgi:hypothetical protein
MVEGLSIITYKNKEIICADYSSFAGNKAKALELIYALKAEYLKRPLKSAYGINNFKNFKFDMDVLNQMKKARDESTLHIKKVAIIGITGLLKAGYNFVIGLTSNEWKMFNSEEEAKEWIAKG